MKQRILDTIDQLLASYPSQGQAHQVRAKWIGSVKDLADVCTNEFPGLRNLVALMNRHRYDQIIARLSKGGSSGDQRRILAKKSDLIELRGLLSG